MYKAIPDRMDIKVGTGGQMTDKTEGQKSPAKGSDKRLDRRPGQRPDIRQDKT